MLNEVKDLIACCLAFDPFSRCSLEDILKHPWVTRSTRDWLTLSAVAGKNLQSKSKKEDERGESHTGTFWTTVTYDLILQITVKKVKDLIACCLAFDPFSRCSLEDILKHPWVTRSTRDWLTLSAVAGKNLQSKPKKEDERDHSEELEEIIEEEVEEEKINEVERKNNENIHEVSTEGESGVGSSASSSTAKTNQRGAQSAPPARFSKTSLLAAPSSDEIKAVVHASKT
ncbi:unnamed protein product, partial [Strongylus vulgaris]